MTEQTITAIVCATCGGDPRTSATCKTCGGAGIGVASPDGFLTWSEPVDEQTIRNRKIRKQTRTGVHVIFAAFGIITFALLIWHIVSVIGAADTAMADNLHLLAERGFWFGGHWSVSLFWLGVLSDLFLIFRLSEYTREEKDIPVWSMTAAELEAHDASSHVRATHRFDVAPYFSPEARDIIESAYKIAKDLKRTEITPETLFASALTTQTGSMFMARLGLSFDAVKQPLARLLVESAPAGSPPISLSRETKRALVLAYANARASRRKIVGATDLMFQSFEDSANLQSIIDRAGHPASHVLRVAEWIGLRERLREEYQRFFQRSALKPKTGMNRAMTAQQTPLLDRYSEDVTRAALYGYLPPLIGREREMASLFRGIESGSRSVVLIGEAGVGKSAIVEELARRMVQEDVPKELFDRRLVSVNVSELIASGDPGISAERLVAMIREVEMSGNIVLVLDGLDALAGSGGSGTMDLAEILARELDRGTFIAIATATPSAWTKYLERRALASRLIRVDIPPLGQDDAVRVLMAKSGLIEYKQNVFFSYASIEKAVTLALRYMRDVGSPENALNVLREAAVAARKSRGENTIVTAEDAAAVVREKTDIPVEAVGEEETQKLLNLEERMHGRVVGQDEAVVSVARALRRARAELREGKRPIANFLFLGPTGVGKTELAKTLAAEMFGDESRMIRLDMSEYQESSSVERMIGAPGDERGGLLTEAIRKKPFSVVLLDEIEKAHKDILNLFLQVMDDGRLTDGVGRTVDFTSAVVIMTSNAASAFIQEQVKAGAPLDVIRTALMERELKTLFRPEFLNRFDGVIVFRPLTEEDMKTIAGFMLRSIGKRLEEKGVGFRAEDAAVATLAHDGYDPQFGARPLRRLLQDRVEDALADLVLRKAMQRGDTVVLQADGTMRVEPGK